MRFANYVSALIFSLFLAGFISAQTTPPPLNRAEILGRLALGQHPSAIARLVKTRGISFSSDSSYLLLVARAGGNGILYDHIFSSSQTPSPAAVDSDPPFALLAKCAELLHSGETEGAETPCRAAIQESPRSPWPVLAALRATSNLQRPDRLELARRAAELGSKLPIAHYYLASTLKSSEHKEIIQELHLAESGKADDLTFSSTVQVLPEEISIDDTIPLTQEQIEDRIGIVRGHDSDSANTHLALAYLERDRHNMDDSLAEMREAIRLEPDVPIFHRAMAYLLLHANNQTEAAIAEFRQAIACEPKGIASRMPLVKLLLDSQHYSDAIQELQQVLDLVPANVYARKQLADTYFNIGDRSHAILESRRLLTSAEARVGEFDNFSIAVDTVFRLEKTLDDAGDHAAARQIYADLLQSNSEDSEIHFRFGDSFLHENKMEHAANEFREALRIRPSYVAAHYELGLCLMHTREFGAAVQELREALRLNPNSSEPAIALGEALARNGETAAAIAHFEEVLHRNEQALQSRNSSAPTEAEQSDYESAQSTTLVPLYDVDRANAENNLAWLYSTAPEQPLRNPKSALFHARRAVELLSHTETSPDQTAAFLDTLAEALLLNGQAKEALKTEEKALTLSPSNPELKSRIERFRNAATSSRSAGNTAQNSKP